MARPSFLAGAIALLLGAVAVAAPVPVAPAAVPFKVGALRVVALRDMINAVPNDGSVFGKDVSPAAVAGVLRAADAPTDRLPLGVDALLVEEPGHLVLIDTGLGPKVGGVLPASLRLAGVDPARITDVLITHSHGDHVGGLLDAAGHPSFPGATIRMTAAEWSWMRGRSANTALVAAIAPRVVTFAAGAQVTPSIRSLALPGHTPGHSGYAIRSGGAELVDIGDVAHSAVVSLARPEWIIGYDNDPVDGRVEREATLARLANTRARVFAPHFPFPGVGRIARATNGVGYVWEPDRLATTGTSPVIAP